MRRLVVTGLLVAAVAVISAVAGFYVGWNGALKSVIVTDLFTSVYHDGYISMFRKDGSDAAYEDALRSQLSFLDAVEARNHDPSNQRMYTFDRALTLARLATLAQKRGASDEAARFARDAEALCPMVGLRNCSASVLVEAAYKIDNGLLGASEQAK